MQTNKKAEPDTRENPLSGKTVSIALFHLIFCFCLFCNVKPANAQLIERTITNPFTEDYLTENLPDERPRLFLTPEKLTTLQSMVENDEFYKQNFSIINSEAQKILDLPLPEYSVYDGRRILRISRESLRRLSTLSLSYLVKKDRKVLGRIEDELVAVCNFPDWNPSHFLDVGEMSLGVSIAYDWVGEDLKPKTRKMVEESLLNKALKESFSDADHWWITRDNNWNQVCHGGLITAAIAIGDHHPEIATRTIHRALDNLHHGLDEYAPSGIYPEGVGYWGYGTAYTIITIEALRSAFDNDFGVSDAPGFMQSAGFVLQNVGNTGGYFSFADCNTNLTKGDKENRNRQYGWFNNHTLAVNLSWFAKETGNAVYFNPESFTDPEMYKERSRFDALASTWLIDLPDLEETQIPTVWWADGSNPLAIFSSDLDNPDGFYLGTKGGKATISHGHMDAGSFILEFQRERWSVDIGNQPYAPLEQVGYDQWNFSQDSPRWDLISKGSQGHSVLRVNDEQHIADAYVPVIDFDYGNTGNPSVTYDLTPLYGDNADSVTRTFTFADEQWITVLDQFTINENTESLTWQMMTTADVDLNERGAVLSQNGEQIWVEIQQPENVKFSVRMLDPPPSQHDILISGLKRMEIHLPAHFLKGREGSFLVRFSPIIE